jgi:uncharacterized membrane protein
MRTYGAAWLATALVFLGLDSIWLSVSASVLYRPLLGDRLRTDFLLAPAALFYLIYTIGVVVFAISPSLASGEWRAAGLRGLFLGLFGYAVYDLTNQATMRDWPLAITLADLAWGSFLTAVAAIAGFLAARMFGNSNSELSPSPSRRA